MLSGLPVACAPFVAGPIVSSSATENDVRTSPRLLSKVTAKTKSPAAFVVAAPTVALPLSPVIELSAAWILLWRVEELLEKIAEQVPATV